MEMLMSRTVMTKRLDRLEAGELFKRTRPRRLQLPRRPN
jgi:hypothetical protein